MIREATASGPYNEVRGTPARELLVLDIGNSTTVIGVWARDDIWATLSVPARDFDGLAAAIDERWRTMGRSKQAVACSVAEETLERTNKLVRELTGSRLQVVGRDLPVPIEVAIEEPHTVGMDRICCAAAAFRMEGRACAVADIGTAITVDCVDSEGRFIGGAILPGLRLQAEALAQRIEALPEVTVREPAQVPGQDTAGAIQCGIVYGSVGAIKELAERYATLLGQWPVLIVTGGDAQTLPALVEVVDKMVPHLCLRGIVLAYEEAFES